MILKPGDVIEGELQDGRYFEGEVVRTACNPELDIYIAILKLRTKKCSPTLIDKVSKSAHFHLPFKEVKFYGIIQEGPPISRQVIAGPTQLIS